MVPLPQAEVGVVHYQEVLVVLGVQEGQMDDLREEAVLLPLVEVVEGHALEVEVEVVLDPHALEKAAVQGPHALEEGAEAVLHIMKVLVVEVEGVLHDKVVEVLHVKVLEEEAGVVVEHHAKEAAEAVVEHHAKEVEGVVVVEHHVKEEAVEVEGFVKKKKLHVWEVEVEVGLVVHNAMEVVGVEEVPLHEGAEEEVGAEMHHA